MESMGKIAISLLEPRLLAEFRPFRDGVSPFGV